ncbi:unnamed protein product [Effrenium voratum]|uniref:Uncharacterized protein n=1 Tax=Effrenium voratum TaxID=2562239 RepID=A0AA36JAI5_9DINO|nr:unnamed protein product [Effrenium voratum]
MRALAEERSEPHQPSGQPAGPGGHYPQDGAVLRARGVGVAHRPHVRPGGAGGLELRRPADGPKPARFFVLVRTGKGPNDLERIRNTPLIERYGFRGYKRIPIDEVALGDPLSKSAILDSFPNTELPVFE